MSSSDSSGPLSEVAQLPGPGTVNDPLRERIEDTVWRPSSLACAQSAQPRPQENTNNNEIRVFISSTFTDFFAEREFLVKFIFPRLRAWCKELGLHLVEVDLRWGVPSASSVDVTLQSCLGEIDRCIEQNRGQPFFINMLGDRYGWVPPCEDISSSIKTTYNWVEGVSVTHMEILHAAYRTRNPNAVFMLRSNDHVKDLPPDFMDKYQDTDEYAKVSLAALKEHIRHDFSETCQVFDYSLQYEGIDNDSVSIPKAMFHGLSAFGEIVFNFLQQAIEKEYILSHEKVESCSEEGAQLANEQENCCMYKELLQAKHFMARVQHNFLTQRQCLILGREKEVESIREWLLIPPTPAPIHSSDGGGFPPIPAINSSLPYVVFGSRKVGKSTVLCLNDISQHFVVFHSLQAEETRNSLSLNFTHDITSDEEAKLLTLRRNHLVSMFHVRLCLELGNADISTRLHALAKDLPSIAHVKLDDILSLTTLMFREEAFHAAITVLTPAVIIIDEADQMQSDCSSGNTISFLTFPLPNTVKCIMSTSCAPFFALIKSMKTYHIPIIDQQGISNNSLDDLATDLDAGLQVSTGEGAENSTITKKDAGVREAKGKECLSPPMGIDSVAVDLPITPSPWLELTALDKATAAEIIRKRLAHYQKTLDADQLSSLMSNPSATNLEWIEYACEEIRTFGAFETISAHIKNLPSSVEDLLLMRLRTNEVIAKTLDVKEAVAVDYVACMHSALRLLLLCGNGLEEEEMRLLLVGATYSSTTPPLLLDYFQWSIVFLFIKPFISHSPMYNDGVMSDRLVIRSDTTRQTLAKYFSIAVLQPLYMRTPADRDEETTQNIQQLVQLFETSPNDNRHITDYPQLLLFVRDKRRLKIFLSSVYFDRCSHSIKYQIRRLLRCNVAISSHPFNSQPPCLRMCVTCSMACTLHPKRLNRTSCFCCHSQIYSRYQTLGGKHSVVFNAMEAEAFMCRRHNPQAYFSQNQSQLGLRQPCALCHHPVQTEFSFPVVLCSACSPRGGGGLGRCSCAYMDGDS